MPFSLPLAGGAAATFDLPGTRDEATILGYGSYPDVADRAYDLEDEDPEAAREAYDRALLAAVLDLGAFGSEAIDLSAEDQASVPADGPTAPEDYDLLVVQDLAAMLYNRGGVRFDLDDLEGSLDDLTASLALLASIGAEGEDVAEVYVRRAETRFALAEVEAAFEDLDAALAEDPEHALAFNNRAVYQAELGETDEAYADIQRALDLDPENALYHVTHAELLVADDREDDALTALETALGHDPEAAPLLDTDAFETIRKHPRFKALLGR